MITPDECSLELNDDFLLSCSRWWNPDFKCACGYEAASEEAKGYVRCPHCGAIAVDNEWPDVIGDE